MFVADYFSCGVVLFFLGMEASGYWRFFLGMLIIAWVNILSMCVVVGAGDVG